MKNKRYIIIAILAIVVTLVAGFLGWYLAKNQSSDKINGLVISIKNNMDYSTKFITTYEEYEEVLKNNGIEKADDKDFLNKDDFDKYDFIVDYIPYEKKLNVNDIKVEILDGGIAMTYYLNKEVESDAELLIYFIPVEKGLIKDFNLGVRNFEYED